MPNEITANITNPPVDQQVIDGLTAPAAASNDSPLVLPDSLKVLKVDGKDVEVRDFEHLKALAQKGVAFEGRYNETKQQLNKAEKDTAAIAALTEWRKTGDVEQYRIGLAAVGYTAEEIEQMTMTASNTPEPGTSEDGAGGNEALRAELKKRDDELAELREIVKDRESHTIQGLIRERILDNDYMKKVLEVRNEENSGSVLEYLVEEATRAAQSYVKEHPYMPSSDREVAEHAATEAIEQARKLGLAASTHLGRGGAIGGPGEVEIVPPKMPVGVDATPKAMERFVSQHLTNCLKDRQQQYGVAR